MNRYRRYIRGVVAAAAAMMTVCAGLAWAAGWGYGPARAITEKDHLQHPSSALNYMEQWSGTVVFGKDHNLNFNLMHSNLTIKKNKAVFRVEYNTPDGKTVEDAKRCSISEAKGPVKLVCGNGLILWSGKDMKVRYKSDDMTVLMKIIPLAKPFRPGDGRLHEPGSKDDFYDFMLMIPRGKAVVRINGTTLQGYGSVDHSYTTTGYQDISRHWMRTTFHDNEVSILFAGNWRKNGDAAGWLSITDNKGHSVSEVTGLTTGDLWKDPDKKGYTAPTSLTMKGASATLTISGMTLKSKKDMLANLSRMEAFVARRVMDPMRYAFRAKTRIAWKAPAQTTTTRDLTVVVKQMDK